GAAERARRLAAAEARGGRVAAERLRRGVDALHQLAVHPQEDLALPRIPLAHPDAVGSPDGLRLGLHPLAELGLHRRVEVCRTEDTQRPLRTEARAIGHRARRLDLHRDAADGAFALPDVLQKVLDRPDLRFLE